MHLPKVYSKRKNAKTPPPNAIYVGRPTKWGNPFVVGKDGTQDECVELYRSYVANMPELAKAAQRELKGKDLVCWCAPDVCHADVLLEVANA